MERTVVLEDCIMQSGKNATAGSGILKKFVSPFDATVVTRLISAGYTIADRVSMDEFGIGDITDDFGVSEAVAAVAEGRADFALCNDIFGKQRCQAAESGLYYLHPTYGTVSRFGLIPAAASMDQIGIVCRDLRAGFELLSTIAGNDPNDGAMFPETSYTYAASEKKVRLGSPEIAYFDVGAQVLCILAYAELSSNLTRYDGVKFGYRASGYKSIDELYVRTRTEGFGFWAKFASIMGSMVLSADFYAPLYEKAMKIRRLIADSLRFDEYDVILLPTDTGSSPYADLALYALAPLAGLPSLTFSHEGRGVQLIAAAKNEGALLSAWEGMQP